MNRTFLIIAIFAVGIGALSGGLAGYFPRNENAGGISPHGITAEYKEALRVIDDNYAGMVDHEQVSESSIQGMLWTLDPHSSFFSRDEYRRLQEEQASRFFGIGVSILQHRDGVYVQSVVSGTPAEKAGLRYGDKFIEVDGKSAESWTSSEVSKNVRGERGTIVQLKLARASNNLPMEIGISRDSVPLNSIRNSFMLRDATGYIGLTGGFQETTSEELDEAISNLKKQGMRNLVLDLRGNTGGLLPQAIEVVSRFIPRGHTVVSVKGRSRFAKSEELRAVGDEIDEVPLVVLINGNSASASEIVAGAIQDYGRGIIVGSDSFGKGLVQRIFPLPAGTAMTLTTARYYTPYGRSLQRDYSNGSIYDYYTHHTAGELPGDDASDSPPKPGGVPVATAGGRVFYGGRGIEPDLKAPALAYSNLRFRINEAAFFFTRQLVAGKIAGLENYKVERQKNVPTITADEAVVSEKVLEAFRAFVASDPINGLTAENINSQLDYAKSRLREEIATATFSGEAGLQVLLESDPQVLRALDALPEAAKMADSFQKNSSSIG
jgi:carboxyl-terminal processing protease